MAQSIGEEGRQRAFSDEVIRTVERVVWEGHRDEEAETRVFDDSDDARDSYSEGYTASG